MASKTRTTEERFWEKVDATGDCWEWMSGRNRDGYGQFYPTTTIVAKAHRFAWETLVGLIPKGLEIDHLCRNRTCVNPDHLDVVTHQENCRRGYPLGLVANWRKKRAQTHCVHGHEFTLENTGTNHGRRFCRACHRASDRTRYLAAKLRRAS